MKAKHFLISIVCMFASAFAIYATPKPDTKKTVNLNVSMQCQSCVNRIEKTIGFEKGVKDMEVNLSKKTVKITFDTLKTNLQTLKTSIENLGYNVTEIKNTDKK
ncbi:conserved exported hypothetical protein [uncultured Paludibacter sp.]|uniref:HMA domain-containing protein n=1 Tax=uncultured Paludibacter sp. TaxID=497635 RepID=A0A653A5V8_9BACT|nr:conserved exported hypothetical protein [uncultured Paludibacter sp.]